jgi:hypothetical protein
VLRGIEQLLHETYNPPLKKINPVNPASPDGQTYLDEAQEYGEFKVSLDEFEKALQGN